MPGGVSARASGRRRCRARHPGAGSCTQLCQRGRWEKRECTPHTACDGSGRAAVAGTHALLAGSAHTRAHAPRFLPRPAAPAQAPSAKHARRLPPYKPPLRAPLDDKYVTGLFMQQHVHLAIATVCLLLCTASNLAAPVLSGMLLDLLVQQKPMEQYLQASSQGRARSAWACAPRLAVWGHPRRRARRDPEMQQSCGTRASKSADGARARLGAGVRRPADGIRAGAAVGATVHGAFDHGWREGAAAGAAGSTRGGPLHSRQAGRLAPRRRAGAHQRSRQPPRLVPAPGAWPSSAPPSSPSQGGEARSPYHCCPAPPPPPIT